ncbi:MAG: hypothetical protein V7641_2242 [Blastocatellia bacterium]
MKFNALRRVVSGAALLLVFSVLLSASAQAQQYRDYQDRNYQDQGRWSRERTRDYAFKLGYHQAYSEAGDYVSHGQRPSFRNMPGYRNDANGYLVAMGNRDDYRNSYRRGYEQGFNDAINGRTRRYGKRAVEEALGGRLKDVYNDDRYDQDDWYNGRNDRDWNRDRNPGRDGRNDRNDLYRIAQQNGYREGLRQGRDDASRRRNSNYENDRLFRDALSGYRSEFGNREDYRRAYREGFRQGYEEGYRNRR